mgnify:CR=1 FL=1
MSKFLLFVSLIASNAFVHASEMTAQQWLEKMSQTMKVMEYQGTIAFFKNGRLDTMKYFHAIENGKAQERLLSLNSPMREVIREAGKVRCVFKDSKRSVVNHHPVSESFIVNLPRDFSNLNTIYRFYELGDESVALRMARVISIEAEDAYRYARNIWIDKTHFLPLKVEVYDLTGATLEQVVFTELSVGSDVDFITTDSLIDKNKVKNDFLAANDASFITNNVPQGFEMAFFTRMDEKGSAKRVEHLLLTDGFSSISIYLEAKDIDVQEGLQTLGSVNSYTHIIDDFQVTAMGEVPAVAVQFVAQGVELLKH